MILRNRTQFWRETRGLTQTGLAERIGLGWDSGRVNKIEKAENIKFEQIERIAAALGVDPIELIDERPRGAPLMPTQAEAALYEAAPDDPLQRLAGPGHAVWSALADSLSEVGIRRGDRLLVKELKINEDFRTGDPVLAIFTSEHGEELPLLRQFIEPNLLTTNTNQDNAVPLNLRAHAVRIGGLILHHIRPARR